MFGAVKDFVVGTVVQPLVDATNFAWGLGWAGAILGGIATLATGNAGFLLMGAAGGVLGGAAIGGVVGLVTGGFRNAADGLEAERAVHVAEPASPARAKTGKQERQAEYQQEADAAVRRDAVHVAREEAAKAVAQVHAVGADNDPLTKGLRDASLALDGPIANPSGLPMDAKAASSGRVGG